MPLDWRFLSPAESRFWWKKKQKPEEVNDNPQNQKPTKIRTFVPETFQDLFLKHGADCNSVRLHEAEGRRRVEFFFFLFLNVYFNLFSSTFISIYIYLLSFNLFFFDSFLYIYIYLNVS